jgi:hypothetical protein
LGTFILKDGRYTFIFLWSILRRQGSSVLQSQLVWYLYRLSLLNSRNNSLRIVWYNTGQYLVFAFLLLPSFFETRGILCLLLNPSADMSILFTKICDVLQTVFIKICLFPNLI